MAKKTARVMPSTLKKKVTVLLTPREAKALNDAAAKQGRSLSTQARIYLVEKLGVSDFGNVAIS